jgi:hypothetical protein
MDMVMMGCGFFSVHALLRRQMVGGADACTVYLSAAMTMPNACLCSNHTKKEICLRYQDMIIWSIN